MKLADRFKKTLSLLGLIGLGLSGATTAQAQAGPAFACSGNIYQVQSGQLRIFDPITSTYLNVGPANNSYNATGYNTLDNYAYASQGRNIIRIASDGTIETVFNIGFGSYSGDIDFSNNYYLRRNDRRYARIDLDTGAVTNINFSGPGGGPADVAYDRFGGDEYLIGFSGGGTLYRYNITDRTKENISLPGLPGGGFGATWTDSNGRLFTFNNNNGILYEVSDYYTNSPVFTQVGVGVPSGNNDGFSCSLAPFPNLAPVAFDDDFVTPLNTDVTGNVLVENGNGVDNDPDGGALTVNPTPLAGPSNGTVTLSATGAFTYTPNTNFIGTDVFEYEITDPAGLIATAFVTIVVEGDISFDVTKTQVTGPNPAAAAGDVLQYEIAVLNTGDIPLTGISPSDVLPDGSSGTLSGPTETGAATNVPGQLDLNETWTYTIAYTVTADDIDAGVPLTNTASVTATETGALPRTDTAVTPIDQQPAFTLSKTVDTANLNAPGLLTYEIEIDNTGNTSLTGVTLADVLLQGPDARTLTSGPTLSGDTDGDGEIDTAEVWTYAATYQVTQADIDDGRNLVNTATVDTAETAAQSADATTTFAQVSSFDLTKTSDTATLTAPGLITYTITLDNTGNTSLTGVTPTDTLTQDGTPLTLTTGLGAPVGDTDGDGALGVDETWVYTVTFAAGQDQIDDGADIINSVTVASNELPNQSAQTPTTITQSAGFDFAKSVDIATLTAPGTLNYEVVVTNTGNVSLTGVTFTDTVAQGAAAPALTTGPDLTGDIDGDDILDVGETWVYLATLDVTQAQIDDGNDIVNSASFIAAEAPLQTNTATTEITQTSLISLSKAVASGQPSSFAAVGDTIDFTYTITNNGNTTLVAPINVTDDQIGTDLACLTSDLLPGATASCDLEWVAEQADLNAGSVTNTAFAEDDLGERSADQFATVTAVQNPALTIVKTIVAPIPTVFEGGQQLNYRYEVTNTGNVTLPNAVIVADNLTTVTCDPVPAGGLLPQGTNPVGPTNTVICTANYIITAAEEPFGRTTNEATASTTFNGANVTSPADTATFPVGASPILNLVKEADPATVPPTEVGDEITYAYTITNVVPAAPIVGAALSEPIFINDDKFADPILCYDPAVEGGSLGVGETHICFATYEVTQDDLDAGQVRNEATANTIFAPGSTNPEEVTSNPAIEIVAVDAGPSLLVAKTVTGGPNPAAVGQDILYQIVATNNGNQTLNTVTISDPLLGALSCDIAAPVTLARSDALTCTGTYTVTQADVDNQTVGDTTTAVFTNTATAQANDPSGAAITPANGSVDHPIAPAAPAVSIIKELFPNPAADPAFDAVNDVVRFRMRVSNTGNMTLSSIAVTDSLVAGTCNIGPLAPGTTDTTCLFDYAATQDDLDAGQIVNTGTATAVAADPTATVPPATNTLTSPGPDFAGALTVIKDGVLDLGPDGVATVGDLITYTITTTNTGNVTITDIAVADPSADAGSITYTTADDTDGDSDIDSLAPMTSATVTATHALTQPDIDAGFFDNSATATGADPSNTPVSDTSDSGNPADGAGPNDPTRTDIPRATGLTVEKTSSATTDVTEGTTITYSYLVTNTGNVTLTDIALSDMHTSASGTASLPILGGGRIVSLDPDAAVTLTATYVVTQDDIDAGAPLTNIVSATADAPAGTTPPTATDNASVDLASSDPSLEVIKTIQSQTGSAAGDTVVFAVAIENTGNVTLDNVSLADTLSRLDGSTITPAPTAVFDGADTGTAGAIDVDETWNYTVTYVLTQDDIDAGGISNTVTATADAPNGATVSDVSDNGSGDGDDPTRLPIAATPLLEVVKTITSTSAEVDDTITFEIAVRNAGNVSLFNVAIISDTLTRADGTVLAITGPTFAGADAASSEGALQVGETATYTASYVLTQDDLDAGGIQNTATAAGTQPSGGTITDVSDDDGPGSDPTVLTIDAAPLITFEKRLAAASGPSFAAMGDVLRYEFEITNAGNVTLTAPFSVADPLITDAGGVITCSIDPIAPGESALCTGDYSIDQDDLDLGEVLNTATATAGAAPPVDDDETVTATQRPALGLVKEADELDAVDFIVGAEETYTFTVTNTGNVTITDPIVIDDPLIPQADFDYPDFPAGGLAPGDVYVVTATYVVTVDDVALANVTNNATAVAGPVRSPVSSETIPNDGTPALTVDKELIRSLNPDNSDSGGLTFDEVGDQLEYQFTVTNSGEVSFANTVTITDNLIAGDIDCFIPDVAGGNPDLTPGETATCTGIYVIDQNDLDAGEVINEAFASTTFGSIPTTVLSPADTETARAATDPALLIAKTVDPAAYTAVNQVVTYTITVTNTGNQTLTDVSVSDPLIPALTCDAASLPVDDVLSCDVPYTIVREDIDRGFLTNAASVTGVDPQGTAVPTTPETTASVTINGPSEVPTLAMRKLATPAPFGPVGSSITYVFEVTNTSIYTLDNITVTDPIPGAVAPFTCDVGTLAPLAVSTTCSLTLPVTQTDIDTGEIVNTASVRGTDPFGNEATATDTATTAGPAEAPAIMATKLANVTATTLGAVVTYDLRVENPGNVSLGLLTTLDQMSRPDGTTTTLDAPFDFQSGDINADSLLNPGEVWLYTAEHTITQPDINAGGFSNSVVVAGQSPSGTRVDDTSDDGDDADGNITDDPTFVEIETVPVLQTTKVIVARAPTIDPNTGEDVPPPPYTVGDEVVFEIQGANTGNVEITGADVTDTLTRLDGTDISGLATGPTRTANPDDNGDPTLAPGEIWTWEVRYTLQQADADAGGISNTATVAGLAPDGSDVSDVSDDGDPTDGNIADDPTELIIPPEPGLDVTKTVVAIGAAPGDDVVFEITAENTGNVTLSGLRIVDTMTNLDGDTLAPVTITVAGLVAGDLAVDSTATYTVTYALTQDDIDSGGISNTATVEGTTPGGAALSDVSDDGDDGDGNTFDDPTIAAIPQNNAMSLSKTAGIPDRIAPDLFEVTFEMTVSNDGNTTLTNLVIEDDLTAFVAPATLDDVSTPIVTGFDTGAANTDYDGVADVQLVTDGAELAPGSVGTILLTVRYDTTAGSPVGENTLAVRSDQLPAVQSASTAVLTGEDADIFGTKTAAPANPRLGDTVIYTLTFQNRLATTESNLSIIDRLPRGMAYVPDSATFDGSDTPAPAVSGRELRWDDVSLTPNQTVTITLAARLVSGGPGSYVNRAYVEDSAGTRVSNVATAEVIRRPEPVFDCADIIGKVFDDHNLNGYQDRPADIVTGGVSDQSYEGSKLGLAPELAARDDEPGLPNVRLSTVTGTLITTDEYGRFSVPCAELPAGIGSNFQLKLDERTLPTGYHVTTENPRSIRVTPGRMAELNFGAALSDLVELDLTSRAFVSGSATPNTALQTGVDQLVAQLAAAPTVVRLVYYQNGENRDLINARLDQVTGLITQQWQRRTGAPLTIERTISRVQ
ncbi:DUF7507 domain-containing protein [Roseobacter sp. CCS2]|uniref:DUF7507 domain-containing protein n=1 Tax=Roseobacter sp. CCS2 TaxID=391593 RepID=UPI0000F3E0B4|nr:Ig-like domain-containing protein [Roseobacter sp. CCS2]EBA11990.1 hypothetical protein RCCS2_11874 [Roseobacter sp. CCS2]